MGSRYNELMFKAHTNGKTYLRPDMPTTGGEPLDDEDYQLTAGYCFIDALLSSYPDKKNDQKPEYVSGTEKVRRYEMAQRIQASMDADEDFDMSGGEQQHVMDLMEKKWSTDIYGQCHVIVHRNGTVEHTKTTS